MLHASRPLAAATAALLLSTLGAGVARASEHPDDVTAATRAALDPALVAGRGADLGMTELEAEDATTDGTVLGAGKTDQQRRHAYTLTAEASGRDAVQLHRGQEVEFVLPRRANAITVRYSIPDAPAGGGIDSPLRVTVNGGDEHVMTLTSRYSWVYGMYPFSNDPQVDPNPGWWKPEPDPVVKPFRPNHFYDEQRLLLGGTYGKGDRLRLTVPLDAAAETTTIDLVDTERVDGPATQGSRHVPVTRFGADPTGVRDSSAAFDAAIAYVHAHGGKVWIPAGRFLVTRHIVVDDVTVEGAGSWWSIVYGPVTPRATPAADGSTHDSPGFYGRSAAEGGSHHVSLRDFAIEGDVRERIDVDQVNAIGGALGGGSLVEGMYLHHTKVGLWLDGPFDGLTVRDNVITDQLADGINLHSGITHVRVTDNLVRGTGDDAIALWSENLHGASGRAADEDAYDIVDHNTVQSPVLANGIAVYGGRDDTISDNLVADPVREGSALHAGTRFGSTGFDGTLTFTRNTTVRAGTHDLNWDIGLGAIWIYALEGSISTPIVISDSDFLDVTENAFMVVADWPVKDLYSITGVQVRHVRIDGTGTNVISARAAGSATFEDVDARGVGQPFDDDCGTFHFTGTPEFSIVRIGDSNDGGWYAAGSWCDDRPPVVEPPAPSPWAQP
ncbi:pectate lyase-like protein [Motilibacter rhizosphaerae]|uniref:Pectate lyase-like protein n=1 Tax=Motilibacter rhizosphaerae TaxID=598652 RepID=A0A4V2F525_9ACTN|nr:glycosyl hydrolase family 28-related protein [Motilibacter rhizosphaerae]RZS91339.1 pectate lyase-like protein [Motilibacter rhizosphaerae]